MGTPDAAKSFRARVSVGDREESYEEKSSDISSISNLNKSKEQFRIRVADINCRMYKKAEDNVIKLPCSVVLQKKI